MGGQNTREEIFKKECERYLKGLSLTDLRCYGRYLNLPAPTNLKKANLIDEIIAVLGGEYCPKRNKRGAPIKNTHFSADILLEIERIREKVYGTKKMERESEQDGGEIGVTLQFSVRVDMLTVKQKKLLNDFLSSL